MNNKNKYDAYFGDLPHGAQKPLRINMLAQMAKSPAAQGFSFVDRGNFFLFCGKKCSPFPITNLPHRVLPEAPVPRAEMCGVFLCALHNNRRVIILSHKRGDLWKNKPKSVFAAGLRAFSEWIEAKTNQSLFWTILVYSDFQGYNGQGISEWFALRVCGKRRNT